MSADYAPSRISDLSDGDTVLRTDGDGSALTGLTQSQIAGLRSSDAPTFAGMTSTGVICYGSPSGDVGVAIEATAANAAMQARGSGNPQLRATSTSGVTTKIQAIGATCGYVGAESNHELRFITNNVARNTIDTSGNLLVRTDRGVSSALVAGLNSPQLYLLNYSAGDVPLTVQGAPSQTAPLTQWKNGVGTVMNRIEADGRTYWGTAELNAAHNFYTGYKSRVAAFQGNAVEAGDAVVSVATGNLVSSDYYVINSGGYSTGTAYLHIHNSGPGDAVLEAAAYGAGGAYVRCGVNNGQNWASGLDRNNNGYKISAYGIPGVWDVAAITPTGGTTLTSLDAGTTPLTIVGAPSQSAPVSLWKNSVGTTLVSATADGSIGIGTGSPGSKLDVFDSASTNLQVRIRNNKTDSLANTAELVFAARSGGQLFDRVKIVAKSVNTGNYRTEMEFATIDKATGVFTSRMTFDSDGNTIITGAFRFSDALADADVPNGSMYKGSDHTNKLCYKDDSGTVHVLY